MNALEIAKLIDKIGKHEVTFNNQTKDYLFNGMPPLQIPADHYQKLYENYKSKLYRQFKQNCTTDLINRYISNTELQLNGLTEAEQKQRVSFLFRKSKGELSDMAEATNKDIEAIYKNQLAILKKIRRELQEIAEYQDFIIDGDFYELPNSEQSEKELISFADTKKAIFALSKTDVILLFYLMEKSELLKFENTGHRNRFIETNFKYTELRNTKDKGTARDISDVNRDISNLKSVINSQKAKNRKAKDALISELYEKLSKIDLWS